MKKYLLMVPAVAVLALACSGNAEDPGFTRETAAPTADGKPDGQALFVQNCAACHQKTQDAVGPALQGVLDRWGGDKGRLYAFIRNSTDAIAKGDPRAVEVKKKYGSSMPAFPKLTDADLDAILDHIAR